MTAIAFKDVGEPGIFPKTGGSVAQFVRSIISINSFIQEQPDIGQPVFVPECGGRWGKPAALRFQWNDEVLDADDEPPPMSVQVEDNNENNSYVGSEVTEDVMDPKTGALAISKYDYVCYIRTYIRETIENEGGASYMPTKVTTIVRQYVDAKPWMTASGSSASNEVGDKQIGNTIFTVAGPE